MPKLTVRNDSDDKSGDFPQGTRLVWAIKELGIDIGHRCGGKARCTTCRVEMLEGEPDTMTQAEYDKLNEKGIVGQYRLSCQMLLERDTVLRPAMTKENQGWPDTGPQPAAEIEPEPEWHPKADLLS